MVWASQLSFNNKRLDPRRVGRYVVKNVLSWSLSEEKYYSMLGSVRNNFDLVQEYLEPDDLLYDSIIKNLMELE